LQFEDLKNKIDELKISKPQTLRHSWYKAVAHNFNNDETVHLKLQEIRLHELKMLIKHKVDHAVLLRDYIIPL
jgi:hypothetical protein